MSKQPQQTDDRYRLTWKDGNGQTQQGTGRLTKRGVAAWIDWAKQNEPNTPHWAEKDGQK